MARGWESKAFEEQISAAESSLRSAILQKTPSPQALESIRLKETILLSRIRVVRELEASQNPRYRAQLTKALADLDKQLHSVGGAAVAAAH
jgi:hypothetical protein